MGGILHLMAFIPRDRFAAPPQEKAQIALADAISGTNCRNLIGREQTHLLPVSILHGDVISGNLLFIREEFVRLIAVLIFCAVFDWHTLEHITLCVPDRLHFMLFHAAGAQLFLCLNRHHGFSSPLCFL
jgi:hypothetical protein